LDSIAERYSERRTHPFHSDKVLAEKGYPTLPSSHAERTRMATRLELSIPRPPPTLKGDMKMKQFLIVLTLVVASAAPAMAVEFHNYTVSAFGR
jgi:hypothetical protein